MAKELEITELRLGLPGADTDKNEKKRVFSAISDDRKTIPIRNTKSQVVGWPPVCTYRKKNSFNDKEYHSGETSKMYVKVSMDGAPFLRKIDLGMHKGYRDLAVALEKLFDCFGSIAIGEENCECVPIYEDKDGDWMLAGDVPWEMFIESCNRLRITRRSDAKGFGAVRELQKTNDHY